MATPGKLHGPTPHDSLGQAGTRGGQPCGGGGPPLQRSSQLSTMVVNPGKVGVATRSTDSQLSTYGSARSFGLDSAQSPCATPFDNWHHDRRPRFLHGGHGSLAAPQFGPTPDFMRPGTRRAKALPRCARPKHSPLAGHPCHSWPTLGGPGKRGAGRCLQKQEVLNRCRLKAACVPPGT
jgi:hypothetical protein